MENKTYRYEFCIDTKVICDYYGLSLISEILKQVEHEKIHLRLRAEQDGILIAEYQTNRELGFEAIKVIKMLDGLDAKIID